MGIKICLFINFILYSTVVSQSLFYLLCMTHVTRRLQASTYIESRQLLDTKLRPTLSGVYYLALLSSLVLVALSATNPAGLLFKCSILSLIALIADIIITFAGNIPINRVINSWSVNSYPADWNNYRNRWLDIYGIRQAVNLAGFIALLTGIVFGL